MMNFLWLIVLTKSIQATLPSRLIEYEQSLEDMLSYLDAIEKLGESVPSVSVCHDYGLKPSLNDCLKLPLPEKDLPQPTFS